MSYLEVYIVDSVSYLEVYIVDSVSYLKVYIIDSMSDMFAPVADLVLFEGRSTTLREADLTTESLRTRMRLQREQLGKENKNHQKDHGRLPEPEAYESHRAPSEDHKGPEHHGNHSRSFEP